MKIRDHVKRIAAKVRDRVEVLWDRAVCAVKGHRWDSERPAGPIHWRDICWRCDAVQGESYWQRMDRQAVETYRCPVCGVPKGQLCREADTGKDGTATLRPYPHDARVTPIYVGKMKRKSSGG